MNTVAFQSGLQGWTDYFNSKIEGGCSPQGVVSLIRQYSLPELLPRLEDAMLNGRMVTYYALLGGLTACHEFLAQARKDGFA